MEEVEGVERAERVEGVVRAAGVWACIGALKILQGGSAGALRKV